MLFAQSSLLCDEISPLRHLPINTRGGLRGEAYIHGSNRRYPTPAVAARPSGVIIT